MAEPRLALGRAAVAEVEAEGRPVELGRGARLDPGEGALELTMKGLRVAEVTAREVRLDPDPALAPRAVARALNRMRLRYYGWPLEFLVRNGAHAFTCREQTHTIGAWSAPVMLAGARS